MTLEDHGLEPAALPARPAIDGSDIRKLTADDVPRISDALARAFYDDPVLGWVFRDESERLARLEAAFEVYLRRIWLPQEECYGVEGLFGAALWLPPDKWHLGPLEQLRLLPSMIMVNRRNSPRMFSLLRMLEKKHPKDRPHYYLAVLGIEPQIQGRGFGSALMQPVLSRCDRDQTPAYLESSKRRNVALYERHGFEVVEEVGLPKGGPPMWRMWREPAGTA
jgi:ribosomal protein S18 acetylase RimI-like enzyme